MIALTHISLESCLYIEYRQPNIASDLTPQNAVFHLYIICLKGILYLLRGFSSKTGIEIQNHSCCPQNYMS